MRPNSLFARIVASTALLLIIPAAQAQDRPEIEIVPQIRHGSGVRVVAFSPDGAQVLSGGYDKSLKLWDAATGRLLRSFEGHSDEVTSVAFSPDGKQVLSGSKLWDVASGQFLRTFEGQPDNFASIAFSRDGARLLSGGQDNAVRIWDAGTGRLIGTFEGHSGGVTSVAFSPDGTRVVSGSRDKTLKLWDVATGRLIGTFEGQPDNFASIAFSRDGARLLSGGQDNAVRIWDAGTGRLIGTFEGHSGGVTSVAFSPDGTRVVSGSRDKTLKLWDVATGRLIGTFEGHSDSIQVVAFSPDGARVLSSSGDKTLKLWDVASRQVIRTFEGDSDYIATVSVAFSADGTRVLSGSWSRSVPILSSSDRHQLWDVETGKLLRTFEDSVAFSPDGTRVVSDGGYGLKAQLWDSKTGQLLRTFGERAADPVMSVAFSSNGALILSGGADNTPKLWDAATGELVRTFPGHSAYVASVAFSRDGTRVLSGSYDNSVKLWDAATGSPLRTFEGYSYEGHSEALSPDGARVLIGSADRTLKLWNATTGQLIHTFAGHQDDVTSVAFSPDADGARVLSGSRDKTLKLWDVATRQVIHTFAGHSGWVTSVAFSPDGRQVLSGSYDKSLKLWDAATGKLIRTLEGHSGWVMSVAFSPDGRQVLSGSSDKKVKLWDAANGKLIRTFEGHSDTVCDITFSPDGTRVLSASFDTTTRLWKTETGELLATLIGARDGEWLTITSAGFFTSSSGGDKMLAVVRGLESYSVRQFYDQFYRPELVRELLAGDVTGRHRDAAAKLDLETALKSGPLPTIALLDKQLDAAGETIQFKVRLYNKHGGGIGRRLIWRLNGNPVGETEPPQLEGKHDSSGPVTVVQGIKIDPGRENLVTVTAYNGANLLATEPYPIKIDGEGIQTAHTMPRSRMFILAIGVNTYEKASSQLASLEFPVNDVLTLAQAFRSVAENGGYDKPVEIIDLTRDKAVRNTIEETFVDLAKRVRRQDTLIVLLSGHGESVAGTYYYYPSDTQLGNGHTIESAGIDTETWARWIASVQVEKKLFIVDTCKSWEARAALKSTDAERIVQEAMANRIQNAFGHSVLTAARDAALESPALGHGVLTYAVLSALGTPQAAKEEIGVKDIDKYVVPEVRRISQVLGKEQEARNRIDSDFPVGRPDPKIAPPPFKSVQVTPGKYVVCGPVIVRSLPSTLDGKINEVLNEQGDGCTEIGVVEFQGSWNRIARAGIERGWVPASAVHKLSK